MRFKKIKTDEATTLLENSEGDVVAVITQEARRDWTVRFSHSGEKVAVSGGKRETIIYAEKKLCEIIKGDEAA